MLVALWQFELRLVANEQLGVANRRCQIPRHEAPRGQVLGTPSQHLWLYL